MDRGNRVKFSPVSGSDDEMGSKGACTPTATIFLEWLKEIGQLEVTRDAFG